MKETHTIEYNYYFRLYLKNPPTYRDPFIPMDRYGETCHDYPNYDGKFRDEPHQGFFPGGFEKAQENAQIAADSNHSIVVVQAVQEEWGDGFFSNSHATDLFEAYPEEEEEEDEPEEEEE